MMHPKRTFHLADVADIEELAEKLTSMTWTLCTGFRLRGPQRTLLFLNDSTSEDGAQEYGVFTENGRQLESITFGWCDKGRAHALILALLDGDSVDMGRYKLLLDPSLDHVCHLCR